MDICTAAEVLRALLEGIDPETGEVLPEGHLVFEDTAQQALALAVEVLLSQNPAGQRLVNKSGHLNAGRPWTKEDLAELRRLYESGVSIDEIARLTQRRVRGVRLQLNLMAGGGSRRSDRVDIPDRLEPDNAGEMVFDPARLPSQPANSYQPWSPEQDEHLRTLHAEHWRVSEIAKTFGRSRGAIESRLKRLGLTDSPPAVDVLSARPWTEEDTIELHQLASQGHSAEHIAGKMRRTTESVKARLFYLGEDVSAPALFPAPSPAVSPSRRWTPEDDSYLRQAWAEGVTIQEMCTYLERRDRLVRCRLVYLDIADRTILGEAAASPELAHQGLPWYPEEIESLQHMFRQGYTHEDMAVQLRRSVNVIRSRLDLLGLLEHAPADS